MTYCTLKKICFNVLWYFVENKLLGALRVCSRLDEEGSMIIVWVRYGYVTDTLWIRYVMDTYGYVILGTG